MGRQFRKPANVDRLARERVNRLFKVPRFAWVTIVLVMALTAMWGIGFVGAVLGVIPTWLALTLCIPAAYAAFTGMHDASHMALGKDHRLSVVAGEICATILLVRFQAFRQLHLRHHRFTNEPSKDPDGWTGVGPRWQLPFRWATTDINYYREYDPENLEIETWQDWLSRVSAVVLVSVLALLLLMGGWRELLLLWVLPARVSLFCAAYIADFVPHMRPHGVPRSRDPYQHTAVIRGWGLSVLLLGHNMHLVHHLYPAVPFYRCSSIWRIKGPEFLARGAREVSLFGSGTNLGEEAS